MGRIAVAVLLLLCVAAQGQTREEKRRLNEERKAAERREKQAKKDAELKRKQEAWEAEHHRRQQTLYAYEQRRFSCGGGARVDIAASAEQVKAELVSRYTKAGFAISSDSTFQVAFMRDQAAQRNFWGYLLFGENLPNHYKLGVQFSMSPKEGGVTASGISEAYVQDGYGRTTRYALGEDREASDQLCTALLEVKAKVEKEAVAAAEAQAAQDAVKRALEEQESASREVAKARKEFAELSEEALDYLNAAMAEVKSAEVIYKMEFSKARDSVNKARRAASEPDQQGMAETLAGLLSTVEECRRVNGPRTAAAFKQTKDGFTGAEARARHQLQGLREAPTSPAPKLVPAIGTVSERP